MPPDSRFPVYMRPAKPPVLAAVACMVMPPSKDPSWADACFPAVSPAEPSVAQTDVLGPVELAYNKNPSLHLTLFGLPPANTLKHVVYTHQDSWFYPAGAFS